MTLALELELWLGDAEMLCEVVPLWVAESDAVNVGLGLREPLGLLDPLGVRDCEAVAVTDDVGVTLAVCIWDAVRERVPLRVGLWV